MRRPERYTCPPGCGRGLFCRRKIDRNVRAVNIEKTEDLDKIKEVFGDEIAYIDSSAYLSTDVQAGRTKMKFEFTGIDYNYQDVQPVDVIYGRYLNEGDVLGRRKKAPRSCSERKMPWGKACG